MTNTSNRLSILDDAISTLATAILNINDDADLDHLDALHAAFQLMPLPLFAELALSCDCCPLHICDIAICADDNEPDCLQYRS